ncbi:MAG: right-handed parallel beta-helix repeat-containing protein [Deltaproteobacteria bacterium]|nr:right-handed parallel beta-helix repeat-containing protein [Deltaproteobacteria bacterium]
MRGHRLLLLLAPTFALSNAAWALDVTVDATTGTTCTDTDTACTTSSVYTAIQWLNATTTTGPHTIQIVDAAYHGTDHHLLRILETSDGTGVTISSDTPTATATKTLPPIISEADLTLNQLRIEAGDVYDCAFDPDSGCEGGEGYVGPVNVFDADLVGTDLELRPGPGNRDPYHEYWDSGDSEEFVPAVYVREGNVTLTSVDIQDFNPDGISAEGVGCCYDGTAVYLDDVWDYQNSHDFTIKGPDCTISYDGAEGIASGIHATGSATGTVDDCDFGYHDSDYGDNYAVIFADSADLTVLNSDFDENNASAIVMIGGIQADYYQPLVWDRSHDLVVENSTFTGIHGAEGCGGAIQVLPPYNWEQGNDYYYGDDCRRSASSGWGGGTQNATISTSTFTNNWGMFGGDVFFVDDIGTLQIDGSFFNYSEVDFNGGSVYLKGVGQFSDTDWTSGAEGGDGAESGGAIFATGELDCFECAFTGTSAEWGGAVALEADRFTTWARFEDSTFANTYGAEGGAIFLGMDVSLDLETTQFLGTLGYFGGAITAFGAEGDFLNEDLGDLDWMKPSEIDARDCTFTGTSAVNGGAFYLVGMGTTARFEDCSFSDTYAGWSASPYVSARPGYEDGGFGGVGVLEPGNAVAIRDSVISNSTAETWGGVLYSGYAYPNWEYIYYGGGDGKLAGTGRPDFGAPLPRVCGDPDWRHSEQVLEGSDIVLDGVMVSDSGAEGASVAYFGLLDHVTVTGSEFTNNLALEDGTFYGVNVEKLDMSCNTFCGNHVGGMGSVLYLFDDGYDYTQPPYYDTGYYYEDVRAEYGGEGYSRDIRYTFKNNILQNNTDDGGAGVVEFEFCDGGSGSIEDTAWQDTFPQLTAFADNGDTFDTFDTGNPWYSAPRGLRPGEQHLPGERRVDGPGVRRRGRRAARHQEQHLPGRRSRGEPV